MTSFGDDRSAAEQQGGHGEVPASAAGDLEFDEAWAAATVDDPGPEPGAREATPTFEDPNDR